MISAFGVQHSVSKSKASREEYKEGRNRYLDEKSEYRTEYKVSAKGASGREKRKLKALKQSKISDSRAANLSTTKIGTRHEKVIGYLAGRAIGGNMENKRQRQNRIDAAKHRRANVYKSFINLRAINGVPGNPLGRSSIRNEVTAIPVTQLSRQRRQQMLSTYRARRDVRNGSAGIKLGKEGGDFRVTRANAHAMGNPRGLAIEVERRTAPTVLRGNLLRDKHGAEVAARIGRYTKEIEQHSISDFKATTDARRASDVARKATDKNGRLRNGLVIKPKDLRIAKSLPSALKAAAKGKKALPDVKDMKRYKYISGKMDANSYGRLSSQFHASARKTDDPSNYFGAFSAGREGLLHRVAAQAALK